MPVDEELKDELGPFTTGLGGALAVAGSILPWAVVQFQPGPLGVEPSALFTPTRHVMGTHTLDGKVTLLIGLLVAFLGIAGLLVRSRAVRRAVGLAALVGGVALVAAGVWELSRISDVSALFNPLRYPLRYRGGPFRHFVNVSRSYGLYVLVASGALVAAGSTYLVLRSRRRAWEPPRHYAYEDG